MSGGPGLSLVLPSRNGAARLVETLGAIATQAVEADVEVIVVDDGSTDGTSDSARSVTLPWGKARIVRHASAQGRGAARNTGVETARGEVIVFLDDDMTLRAGALAAHRSFHLHEPAAAARGRVVLPPARRDGAFDRFLAREETLEEDRLVSARHDLPFALFQTGHLSIRREVLIAAGGFDASITRYGFEDIELGYRLAERGMRLAYLPEAESLHRAYAIDLDRYLERHLEAGIVARQLAERHPDGPLRAYLRVDPPERLGIGRDPAGLVALRLSNRLLLRRWFRRALGSRAGFAALRAALRAGERLGLDRAVGLGYHVARDVRYFQGYFAETPR